MIKTLKKNFRAGFHITCFGDKGNFSMISSKYANSYSDNVAKKILEHFLNMLKEGSKLSINSLSEDQNTTMMSLSGVNQFPMRVKCATLAWHTFMYAAEGKKETVNTEKAD